MCKVSVIIPVYNVEEYIEETLTSLFNQTLDGIEVILVDDGSTDKSVDIINNSIKGRELYRLITQENGGPSKARNRGIREAKGTYIAFMDSDDVIPKDSLKIRYENAIKHNADIVLGGTYGYDGKNTWIIKTHFGIEGIKTLQQDEDLYLSMGPCNKIYKKTIIKDLEFPENLKYGEDQVFVMNAYLKAEKIFKTNEVVYYYRQRGEKNNSSLTGLEKTNPNYVLSQVKYVLEKIFENIDRNITNRYEREIIKEKYFERVLSINIWPPFKNGIVYGDNKEETFKCMENILEVVTDETINKSEKLLWIVTQGIVDKFTFLKGNEKKAYSIFFRNIYRRISTENKEYFKLNKRELYITLEKVSKSGHTREIFKYLFKRKLKDLPKKIILAKRIIFKIANLLPKKEDMVVLASNKGNVLSGNLKAINDELEKQKKYNIQLFLAKDTRSVGELIYMDYILGRSKYIVIDDYYRQIYGLKFKKTEVIQVWHACGAFKKFGFSAIGKRDGNTLSFEERAHNNYTKVIASSKNIIEEYSDAFNISKEKILPIGVPRTDILLDKNYKEFVKREFINNFPKLEGKKVILYAPTFRGDATERQRFKLKLNPIELLENISKEYVLVLKFHPSVKNGLSGITIPEEFKDRLVNLDSSSDINDLMLNAEILITDYSSVVFEGALLDKKMILFAYDKEEYLGERDFYYDYDSFVPGKIARTNEEIVDIIKNDAFDMEKVESFKNRFFDHYDGQASKRFVENIFN